MSKEISRSSPVSAWSMVDRINRGNLPFNLDRPHRYKWTEHPELSIEDPNYFTIEIIWLDEEEDAKLNG